MAQDIIFYQNNYSGSNDIKGINALFNKVFTGDSQNKNGYNSAEDDLISSNTFGRVFSFVMTYNF